MKISAIIVTYNRPDALEAILQSILCQMELPGEVIIADDGSGQPTSGVINKYSRSFPVPLKHVWHEDRGFRGAAIRNRAVRESRGDYLLFSDGDLMFHPSFFRDFRKMARPGSASIASRLFLTKKRSENLLSGFDESDQEKQPSRVKVFHPHFFSSGIEKNRINAIHSPLVTSLLPPLSFSERVRGGLLGVWREDLIKVNGWNEDFSGWGFEDTEVVARLHFSGISLRKLKFSAICWHLWHPPAGRELMERNRSLLDHTISGRVTWCRNGLASSSSL